LLIAQIILGIALIGTVSSAVFLVLTLLGVLKFRRQARMAAEHASRISDFPPVSLLKPVHGLEAQLEKNIESFFRQDYPDYEILFGADEADDPALEVVRGVCARYPQIPSRIVVHGKPPWPNPQTYSLHRLAEAARHEILVASDSDVEVCPSYLREVVSPLLDPKVGMTTCLYRGKNVGDFWSFMSALCMSVEEPAGVLVANLLEGMKFGLGPTIALRRSVLAQVGGYAAFHDYSANDFILGNLINKAGYEVALSRHVIDHIVNQSGFRRMWQNQLRWSITARYCRPKGFFGMGLIFAMPYGMLGLAAGVLLGRPGLGLSLLGLALLNRLAEAFAVGWCVNRDREVLRKLLLYPVRDLLGFIVWCASYMGGGIAWRDSRFELAGERMVLRQKDPAVGN
jgi:ceramide glucosyltransferase